MCEGQHTLVNVRQDTTLSNGDVAKEFVQLLVIADSKLEMTRNYTSLLVVSGGVTSQLEDFSGEVLQNSGKVDRGTYVKSILVPTIHFRGMHYQHRRAGRSFLYGEDGEHDQQGTQDQP